MSHNRRSRTTTAIMEVGNVVNVAVKDEQGSTHKNPILVDTSRNSWDGSQVRPISLDEDDNGDGKTGSDENPILIDDYHVHVSSEVEAALLQIAIQDSMTSHADDPKGKKVMKEYIFIGEEVVVVPDTEIGESSRSPPVEPDEYCGICMEPKFRYECFNIKGCLHYYCTSCVCQYVEAKIEENVSSIGCPDPGCKEGFLEPEMCQMILKPDVFHRWGSALCEAMIGAMKFYCPFEDCSALLIDEGQGITQAECPHCFRLFCAQCKVPWHVISCEEYQKLGVDERGKEDIMLKEMAKSCKWQRCPVCKFYVERISGCVFMLCRCGHKFCYGCAKTMTTDHFCQNCKRCWD